MTDPIRAALERLVARLDETTDPNGPVPAWTDSFYAARAALSADEPGSRLAVHPDGTPMVSIGEAAALGTIARLAADLEHARTALAQPAPPAEALAVRPLLEQVARMGDRIGQHTVGEIMAISDRAAAWLADNPPGQPVAIEPRGCPTPGACSCVEPQPPAEGEVATIAARPKELSRAVTEERWQEFSMRVPAEPLRDADLVMDRAAALLQQHQSPQSYEVRP